jgi:hypothetical protein
MEGHCIFMNLFQGSNMLGNISNKEHREVHLSWLALTALSLIKKQGKGCPATIWAECMTGKSPPDYLGEIPRWQVHVYYPGMMNFDDSFCA